MINSYLTCSEELDDRAIHLLFSANRWLVVVVAVLVTVVTVYTASSRWEQEKEIRSSLAEGTNILIDR